MVRTSESDTSTADARAFWEEPAMYQKILVPIDLADLDFAKPALATAASLAGTSGGAVR